MEIECRRQKGITLRSPVSMSAVVDHSFGLFKLGQG
jgi:hypothetical protein